MYFPLILQDIQIHNLQWSNDCQSNISLRTSIALFLNAQFLRWNYDMPLFLHSVKNYKAIV